MNFDYYHNFIAIVEAGNLSAAAKKLKVAQPALSNQLKILSEEYGTPLVKLGRGLKQIELTEAGTLFLARARYLCNIDALTRAEIQKLSHGETGVIKIGVSPASAASFIEKYITPFCKQYPEITYRFYEVSAKEQTALLERDIINLAIANAPVVNAHNMEILKTNKIPLKCITTRETPWPQDQPISLTALANVPLCLNYGCYSLLHQAFQEVSISPNIRSLSITKTTALSFAAQKLGAAIVPIENSEQLDPHLLALPLDNPNLFIQQTIYHLKGAELPATVKKFLQTII